MRGFVSYVFAGILVVLTMDVVAPPVGLGLAVMAWPAFNEGTATQAVNRAHKGDRLQIPTANRRRMSPPIAPASLVGCEPVFSALSSSAHANYPGRCVA
jgi:hypothetical protein